MNVEKHKMNNIKKPQKDDFIDHVSSKEVKSSRLVKSQILHLFSAYSAV